MGPSLSWDTIRQLKEDLDGGETHILKPVWVGDDAWMELRCNLVDLDGGEMLPGCRQDANIRTQIEVRFNWDKEETWIWEPGWRGDTNLETWMGLRWNLDWVEMHILRRGWGDMGLGWSWDTILQLRKGLDGGETHILKPVWVSGDAWMELGCNLVDLDGGEMLPGWSRDANIRTQIEVRFNWDKEETWIWEPGWRRNTNLETWMGLRWDLDWI